MSQIPIDSMALATFTEHAYLDYAMYVILDRALPHIADGLKPVQRRILYAMSELGLHAQAKYKKSARTIGDVLGKFHPHGDTACYEAMVLMAQSFSYRYPLIDGQGNWGAPDDPKSFAAMRYTEARLSAFAAALLGELHAEIVPWSWNFDATLREPKLLPARLPVVLLNGASGIAVGMSTDIPPHAVEEVVAACLHLLEHPTASVSDLCQYIQGPDFPTEAPIITPRADLERMYQEGHGAVRQRAAYRVEGAQVIIDALPYQVSGSKVLEQLAQLMQQKKLPHLIDLQDASDHTAPTRLLLTLKHEGVDIAAWMEMVFAQTDLERSIRVHFNMIGLDGKPQVKPLDVLLREWLAFRRDLVRKRSEQALAVIQARLEILAGLQTIFLHLDRVIQIIREEDDPKQALQTAFLLSDRQVESILEIRLRQLARIQELALRTEQRTLETEAARLQKILGSERALTTLIRQELEADGRLYGNGRRTPLVTVTRASRAQVLEVLPKEPVCVVLSARGWIRALKSQSTDGRQLAYQSGDHFLAQVCGHNQQCLLVLDQQGRTYGLSVADLPSARGFGEPVSAFCDPPAGVVFVDVLLADLTQRVFLCSDRGYGFVSTVQRVFARNRGGRQTLVCGEGESRPMPWVVLSEDPGERVLFWTSDGALLLVESAQLPLAMTGKGRGGALIRARRGGTLQLQQVLVLPAQAQLVYVPEEGEGVVFGPRQLREYQGAVGSTGTRIRRMAAGRWQVQLGGASPV